jgi:hypothetical protein
MNQSPYPECKCFRAKITKPGGLSRDSRRKALTQSVVQEAEEPDDEVRLSVR